MRRIAAALAFALAMPALAATAESVKSDSAKSAPPTKGEVAKADQNRRKPLQRCDELKDKAQLDCLQKAREKIVEARAKREAKGDKK
ncbi:MAG TPA: hypothetical protein VHP37_03185 [Burkholderiales bacterium]|nr:hypothetical protein [Burkholderiales bacterium]